MRLHDFERLGAVAGFEDVASLFEDHAHRGPHALLVVHDEDRAPLRGLALRAGHGRRRSITMYWLAPAPAPLPTRWT